MSKTVEASMTTHLGGSGTSLALCWKVTRVDGEVFGFTSHDEDIDYKGVTYLASSGFKRTAIVNTADMAVDNLDVSAILTDAEVTQADLINGLFDRADVEIFAIRHDEAPNYSSGIIKMRKGQFGEIQLNSVGSFTAEVRGLVQRLSHNFLPQYQPTCRNDLGDSVCQVPINPDVVQRNTAYTVGDFVRSADELATAPYVFPLDNGDTAEELGRVAAGTAGTQATIDAQGRFGGAVHFKPSGSADPSEANITYSDIFDLGSDDLSIECRVMFDDLSDGNQVFLSKWTTSSNQRSWMLGIQDGTLYFAASTDGSALTLELEDDTYYLSTPLQTGVWYHFAVTRSGNDWRLFFNGQLADQVTSSFTVFDSTAPFRMGKFRNNGGDDRPLFGRVDDVRVSLGTAQYTASFTPPSTAHTTDDAVEEADYDNRIYECTTAGTTAATHPTYDTVVDNDTTDGTAVFTARQSWMRNATINTVTSDREFTITITESRAVDDWFNGGVLEFLDGDNKGRRIEIKDWVNSSSTITLWDDAFFALSGGEKIRLYPGCDKTRATCLSKFALANTTNFADGNVVNFNGEPHVPGEDFFLQAGSQS